MKKVKVTKKRREALANKTVSTEVGSVSKKKSK